MTRSPYLHRRYNRACPSPQHRQLRQAALLLDLQELLQKRSHIPARKPADQGKFGLTIGSLDHLT